MESFSRGLDMWSLLLLQYFQENMPFPLFICRTYSPPANCMKSKIYSLICAVVLSIAPLSRAEVGAKVTFPSFSDGHIYGEKIVAQDLRGKVVFFEYWGINCPPCRAAMPHLVEMQRKYGSRGLVVIGSHVQLMSPAVTAYLAENKVNFPIYAQKHVPEAPCPGGIPYSVLIGGDGRVIAEGFPSQLYGKVEAALAQAAKGYPILEGVELDKYKSLEKSLVSNGSNVEGKVEALRPEADGGDAEAQAICDAYDAWLAREKERIARLCETNPMQAVPAIASLKKAAPSVTEFDGNVQAFRENPVYQKLATVQKKVKGLQKRQAEGKRVSAGPIKGLRKSLAELRGMEGKGVECLCDSLDSELDALEQAVEASQSGKKAGRRKRAREDD